ncbi:hypothetical protein [Leifsonia shinshuensis]|uniref:hypothetical protein n=1 Tax=Leifsonia shinshuensis TaxID=150026 RepID=UPI002862FBA9|nr:hypothetical protein [Leifsonia shinshuensis]MDR6970267.1 hypothetical protein [Leifsonia shinshuensis]
MRFVLAIVAFVVAAVMIVAGIAQRTVFAPPSRIQAAATVSGDPRYLVIDGSVLNAHPGQQTLTVTGAPDAAKQVVAYGRTADVKAWLSGQKYVAVGYQKATGKLSTKAVTAKPATSATDGSDSGSGSTATPAPTPSPTATAAAGSGSSETTSSAAGPNPAGSDLWLEEFDGDAAQVTRMNIPDDVSVIVASDGQKSAPSRVSVTWPVDSSTPWAFPLIIGGLILLVIGIALYLWGLYTHRRSRGPRRKSGPKMPKLPKAPKYKPTAMVEATPRGRRSTRRARVMLPVALAGALALTGCTAGTDAATTPSKTATPLATEAPNAKDQLPPAVTVPQLERIVKRISESAAQADAKASADLAKVRFMGPALQLREANYAIRAHKSDEPALPAIPASPIVLSLPQATDTWPRTVAAVIQSPKDAKGNAQAPIALTMVQETPRDNYQVEYAVSLEPKAKVPNLAPASIGSAVVPPDSKLLALPPEKVSAAYGDILMNGDKSQYASLFNAEGDTLRTQVGADWKAKQKAAVPATASLTFTTAPGSGSDVAMATNDSGAIVWTDLQESQVLKVVEAGAEVSAGNTSAALSGVASSKTGIESTFGYQLAFYVPPVGSKEKITLLGFAQGMIAAKQIP